MGRRRRRQFSASPPGTTSSSMNIMEDVKSPEKLSPLKVALLFTLCLRVFYSAIGALITPYLKLAPELIRANDFTENLTSRSAGLAYVLWGGGSGSTHCGICA